MKQEVWFSICAICCKIFMCTEDEPRGRGGGMQIVYDAMLSDLNGSNWCLEEAFEVSRSSHSCLEFGLLWYHNAMT